MNIKQVKTLGRTSLLQDVLYLPHSASGVEFRFEGSLLKIQLTTDQGVDYIEKCDDAPRVGIWMNNKLIMDFLVQNSEQEVIIYNGPPCSAIVKVIKLSEYQHSSLGIKAILSDSNNITPTPKKNTRIEFIGDSITCGYGVDGDVTQPFSTRTENATKTFAYLVSQALDADYSMISFSGHGLLSGYTDNGIINTECLVQPLYASFGEYTNDNEPDLIVINLGTNDQSYVQGDYQKTLAFQEAYYHFLVELRAIHPQSTLLCTLGIMGVELYPAIEDVVTRFKEETLDYNIAAFSFTPQLAVHGYGSDWHPSYRTAQLAANKMIRFVMDATNLPIFAPLFSSKKLVAFTFDDGPNTTTTNEVLDVLESYGVVATFFVIGSQITETTKEVLQRAHKLGCDLQNHSYTHSDLAKADKETILEELQTTSAKIEEAVGLSPIFFRPPYISTSPLLYDSVPMPFISGISALDWEKTVSAEKRIELILEQVQDGSIVLLHDMEGNDATVKAIAHLIPHLLAEGYEFVTVAELFRRRNQAILSNDTRLYESLPMIK